MTNTISHARAADNAGGGLGRTPGGDSSIQRGWLNPYCQLFGQVTSRARHARLYDPTSQILPTRRSNFRLVRSRHELRFSSNGEAPIQHEVGAVDHVGGAAGQKGRGRRHLFRHREAADRDLGPVRLTLGVVPGRDA